MPQVLRYDHGPVTISVRLLEEIEAALMMDTAEPRSKVAPVADAYRAARASASEWRGGHLVLPDRPELQVHDWLDLMETDAVQRLRGWHRARYGAITVEARWLAEARNILDGVTLSADRECDEALSELDYDPVLHAQAAALIAAGEPCGECEWCVAIVLRDRIDDLMDAAGFYGGSYYRAYGRPAERDRRAA